MVPKAGQAAAIATNATGRQLLHRLSTPCTGAGVSAESGMTTFRGAGGLWRQFDPSELGERMWQLCATEPPFAAARTRQPCTCPTAPGPPR